MADQVLLLCIQSIEVAVQLSSSGSVLLNRMQCQLLATKLSESGEILHKFRERLLSGISDSNLSERSLPAANELLLVLYNAMDLVKDCCYNIHESWLMVAIKQGDMEETFAEVLHDVRWHVLVLCSILFTERSIHRRGAFNPTLCNGSLDMIDNFALSTAAKADKDYLKDHLLKDYLKGEPQILEKNLRAPLLKVDIDMKVLNADTGSRSWVGDKRIDATLADKFLRLLSIEERSSSASIISLFLKVEMHELPEGRFIGKGGHTDKVIETKFNGEKFAMKIFSERPLYERELEGYAGLNHPHVMRIVCCAEKDCCTEKERCAEDVHYGKYAVVMEHMPEKDLFTFLAKWRKIQSDSKLASKSVVPFSLPVAIDLMLQVGEGLKYIHDKKKSHCDVKSLNILIKVCEHPRGGKWYIAKVADLGHTKKTNTTTMYSTSKIKISTRNWKAPELFKVLDGEARPHKLRTPKTDVYSFGIVCSEILTGQPPWDSVSNLLLRLKNGERPPLPDTTPSRLCFLIQRCWEWNPQRRPSFHDICRELRYMKGLILRNDLSILQEKPPYPISMYQEKPSYPITMNGVEAQGPWGAPMDHGGPFNVLNYESITKITVHYQARIISCFTAEYTINGMPLRYSSQFGESWHHGHRKKEILINEPSEFLTQMEGSYGTSGYKTMHGEAVHVTSLTMRTNVRKYGPYGTPSDKDTMFQTTVGQIVGFHGRAGSILDSIGVFIIRD